MAYTDYYAALGVDKSASDQEIKEAYRKLAFKYHPDRNSGNAAASDEMKTVNEAYAVLSDPQKRSEYNSMQARFGSSATQHFRNSYSDQDIFRDTDIHQVFEELAKSFGFRSSDDIFRDVYGARTVRFTINRPGRGRPSPVFSSNTRDGGPGANRPGINSGLAWIISLLQKLMLGTGAPKKGRDLFDVITISPSFAAGGGPFAYRHPQTRKKLVVNIPAGIRNGQKLRLAGMGDKEITTGASGDLYVKVIYRKPLLEQIKGFFNSLTKK